MRIYRVASRLDGHGPYTAPPGRTDEQLRIATRLADEHSWGRDPRILEHPTPPEDGLPSLYERPELRCAFASLDALYDWFEGWLAQLDQAGFEIQVFDAVVVLGGFKQVLFDPAQTIRVDTLRLVERAA